MKYLIILPLLFGCLESVESQFRRGANDICKCYGGLDSAQLGYRDYYVQCKDGTFFKGGTPYEESPTLIGGDCK